MIEETRKPLTLNERARGTKAVLDRFQRKPLDYEKRQTCIHLLRAQLIEFGHSPPPVPMFRTPLSARRALRKAGFKDLAALLDSLLPRIAPARMLVGDVALFPGDDGNGGRAVLDAVLIHGGGKMLGWRGDGQAGMGAIELGAPVLGAWRMTRGAKCPVP